MAHATVREEHPLPAIIMHWLHLIAMVFLIVTGFLIHDASLSVSMSLMRALHFIFMFVLIVVAIARVVFAFVGRSSAMGSRQPVRDYRHFGYQRENRGTFWPTVKYYLFLRKRPPAVPKFNTLQKATYVFWLLLIIAQAITGFAIWTRTQTALLPLTYALGGPQYMRMYHYLIMWLFIVTVAVHIYLSAIHPEQVRLMFLWRESGGRMGGPDEPTGAPMQPVGGGPAAPGTTRG